MRPGSGEFRGVYSQCTLAALSVLSTESQDPCSNLFQFEVCASLHTSSPSPSYAPLPLNSLFREGLTDASLFTALIPASLRQNANDGCSVSLFIPECILNQFVSQRQEGKIEMSGRKIISFSCCLLT